MYGTFWPLARRMPGVQIPRFAHLHWMLHGHVKAKYASLCNQHQLAHHVLSVPPLLRHVNQQLPVEVQSAPGGN